MRLPTAAATTRKSFSPENSSKKKRSACRNCLPDPAKKLNSEERTQTVSSLFSFLFNRQKMPANTTRIQSKNTGLPDRRTRAGKADLSMGDYRFPFGMQKWISLTERSGNSFRFPVNSESWPLFFIALRVWFSLHFSVGFLWKNEGVPLWNLWKIYPAVKKKTDSGRQKIFFLSIYTEHCQWGKNSGSNRPVQKKHFLNSILLQNNIQ